jgi:hypothetical protein
MGAKRAIRDGDNKLCKRCDKFKNAELEFYSGKAVCKPCHTIEQREHYTRDAEKINRRNLLTRYNLTEKDFKILEEKSNGVCNLCGQSPKQGNELVIDHCHITSKVRGLIHRKCNLLLGYANDNTEILRYAVHYLEKHELR